MISRRRGSAIALKTSEVVVALAMEASYIPIKEYVKPDVYALFSMSVLSTISLARWRAFNS
jgi:hypothetical protein